MSARFVGYWLGYVQNSNNLNLLNQIPSVVTNVNLFKGGVTPTGSQLNTTFLCTNYDASQLIQWSQQLQQQNGTAVSMSLMDTPQAPWDSVDIATYAQSVNSVALRQWGLRGIDVDAESQMSSTDYVTTMVSLVTSLREAIGNAALLTYTCYTYGQKIVTGAPDSNFDEEIIPQIAGSIDWINTMGYFWTTSQQEQVFDAYAALPDMSPEKICIGVGCGYQGGASTPLDECTSLASWQPSSGSKCGMMLFNTNNDNQIVTGESNWTWTNSIAKHLSSS
jgi:hypothetical protein